MDNLVDQVKQALNTLKCFSQAAFLTHLACLELDCHLWLSTIRPQMKAWDRSVCVPVSWLSVIGRKAETPIAKPLENPQNVASAVSTFSPPVSYLGPTPCHSSPLPLRFISQPLIWHLTESILIGSQVALFSLLSGREGINSKIGREQVQDSIRSTEMEDRKKQTKKG